MSLRWSFGLLSLQGCAFRYTFHDGQSRSKLIESDGQSAALPRQRMGGVLRRVFVGWWRGEGGHGGMVAIPTMEEEDARRPSRKRESLVNERSRIVNRMKSALARLGIRGFKPHLRRAPERLACLRTAEGT